MVDRGGAFEMKLKLGAAKNGGVKMAGLARSAALGNLVRIVSSILLQHSVDLGSIHCRLVRLVTI